MRKIHKSGKKRRTLYRPLCSADENKIETKRRVYKNSRKKIRQQEKTMKTHKLRETQIYTNINIFAQIYTEKIANNMLKIEVLEK